MKYGIPFFTFLTINLMLGGQQELLAETVYSPHNPPRVNRVFSVHDHNKDGYLNRSEFQEIGRLKKGKGKNNLNASQQPMQFNHVDTNQDGLVSEDELIDALNKRLRAHRKHRYKSGAYPRE